MGTDWSTHDYDSSHGGGEYCGRHGGLWFFIIGALQLGGLVGIIYLISQCGMTCVF
jgi:hypothetical protein